MVTILPGDQARAPMYTPGVASLLFEKQARPLIGDHLYPSYGVPAVAVGPEDVHLLRAFASHDAG